MLKNFWPIVDYKKLINIQSNSNGYKLTSKNNQSKKDNLQIVTQKSKKLKKHQ